MDESSKLLFQVLACLIVLAAAVFTSWSKRVPSVGLPVSYLLSVGLIHFVGGFAHTLPWHSNQDSYYVFLGFEQCFYGILSFGVAALVVVPLFIRPYAHRERKQTSHSPRLPEVYIAMGVTFFAVLAPILRNVPSIGAITVCGIYLAVVGFCLACWRDWHHGRTGRLFFWLVCVSAIPIVTVVTIGFIGYGATAAMVVFAFVFSFYRPRWQVVAGVAVAVFFGLSLFITYFRDRDAIRELILEEEGYSARIDTFVTTLKNFELVDFNNDTHLEAIDLRLNQNIFVGHAIDYIGSGAMPFARGHTLTDAALAMVPRIFWPDKPMKAGGRGLVSAYTGLEFGQNTSIGVGHVLEFYINFGTAGVVVGFFILGIIIRVADFMAGSHLRDGNWPGFMAWLLPSLTLLNTEGSLIELTSRGAASLVLVVLLNRIIMPRFYPRAVAAAHS
jgi:hypothetical protein